MGVDQVDRRPRVGHRERDTGGRVHSRGTEVGLVGLEDLAVPIEKRNLVEPDLVAMARVDVTDRVRVCVEEPGNAVRALGDVDAGRPERRLVR